MRRALLVVILATMSACAVVGEALDEGQPVVVASLEVHNRTLDDLLYVAADGERLEVPACGSAADPTFRIDAIRVRAAEGYVRGFGVGDPALNGQEVHVVEVASAANSGLPTPGPAPDPLPPCAGHAEEQPGT